MTMRIVDLDNEPFRELRYLNADRAGRTEVARLPMYRARVNALPDGLDAIIATSDLQGVAPVKSAGGQSRLLGEALVEELVALAEEGVLPPAARTGVVLAGDLYSDPQARRRGGRGDVTEVWRAFSEWFAWVVGVAGNHDELAVWALAQLDHVSYLDGTVASHDGIRFGGVSGIIGTKNRPNRRAEDEFLDHLVRALAGEPEVVVLHEGPDGDEGQRGNAAIREWLDEHPALVICGHVHWQVPLHVRSGDGRSGGGQTLNVDTRVVLLTR